MLVRRIVLPTLAGLAFLAPQAARPTAAAPPYPTTLVPVASGDGIFGSLGGLNRDGTRALVSIIGNDHAVWVGVPGGELTDLSQFIPILAPAPPDGRYAWTYVDQSETGLPSTTVVRYDAQTGDTLEIPVQFPRESWSIVGVTGSADGNVVAVRAYSDHRIGSVTFLFAADGSNLTGTEGLSTATNTTVLDISPHGTFVTYAEYCCVGAQYSQIVRWNRSTSERVAVAMPAEHTAFEGTWTASVDLEWVVFWSDGQLHRRNGASGATETLPGYTTADPLRYRLTRGGRVVFEAPAPVADGTEEGHLYLWDVGAAPQLLTNSVDGGPVDHAVEPTWRVSQDGDRMVFTSYGTNLVGGTPTLDRRLYVTTLPPLDLPPLYPSLEPPPLPPELEPGAVPPVAPASTVCATAGVAGGRFAIVNVTPVNATGAGFGTIHSSDDPAGPISNANFDTGTVDPNVAIAEVGADGKICFTNSEHSTVDVIVDQLATGSPDAFSSPTTTGAARLLDTRTGLGPTTLAPSGTACVLAVGADPGDFTVVNVTPINATGAGFGTVHSSVDPAGTTSNVNFDTGTVDPNVAIAKVGADGKICFTNSEHNTVDVIVDQLATGAPNAFTSPTAAGAARLMDTRAGIGAITFAPSATACVAAVGAEPGDFAVVNVTPIDATGPGFGTIHSSDDPAGPISNVNFNTGTVDPNVAIAEVGADGKICFTNSEHSTVDVIVDQLATGSPDAFASPTATGAARMLDTRS